MGLKSKVKPLKRCKVWKLKQAETRAIFSERVQARADLIRKESRDVEKVWKDLKDCFLEEAVGICGETQGIARRKETWWWNEHVVALIKEKQRLFNIWKGPKKCKKGCRCEKRVKVVWAWEKGWKGRVQYGHGNKEAGLQLGLQPEAKNDERKRFCEDLEREDEKGKQMVNRNRDVVGASIL